ncbi:hypothetical protein N2384_19945 [Bacillus paralicheniformis]|uniref:hypothetical protein n=1 Tax=Bacillus paralicheniformis TaxID=1648923 RepID=UPI0021A6A3D4|nr:hypothetical protein [Bacillus paralicheniformis]UWS60247.1 hypothetical protein N2384_19945 [Bacillus paralicheniformis]
MKDRKSRALSIRTIFSRPGNQTSIVSQKRVDAGGDVTGIKQGSDADRRLSDENEAVHAENRQLTEKVKELYTKIDLLNAEIEDLKTKNVLPGLIAARDFVEGLDGRTGKRQITEKLSALIVDEEERNDG